MKTGILLGAGFSYDLGMPISRELTEVFLNIFNRKNVNSLVDGLATHQPYSAERPINKMAIAESFDLLLDYKKNNGENYEELLAEIQELSEYHSKSQSDKDSYHYIFSLLYETIHNILSIYQSISYETLYPKNLKWFSKFENLFSAEETWVFSLNHDLFLECLAIDLSIPITYGSQKSLTFPVSNIEMNEVIEFSCIASKEYNVNCPGFIRGKKGINLVKLHGSLSEHEYKDEPLICNLRLNKSSSQELMDDFRKVLRMAYYHQGHKIPSGPDRAITDKNGQLSTLSKAILTGGKKYSKTAKPKEGAVISG